VSARSDLDMAGEPDAGGRPTLEQWIALRQAQGRVTPEDWTKGPILLGYQQRLVASCAANAVTVCEKSRRTGATWAAAAYAVTLSATARADGGMDTLYMGTSHDMAKEFVDACAMWARALDKAVSTIGEMIFIDGSDRGVAALKIDFASGYSIVALSSKPRSLRGRQGFAILDEAAFVDNLPELMKAALAFLIRGGKVLVISTHNGGDNAFSALVTDIRAGRRRYGLVRFDLDDALKDGMLERIWLSTGDRWTPAAEARWREELIADYGEGADEELYCVPSQGSGAWLPAPLIEARMHEAPVLRLAFPPAFALMPDQHRQSEVRRWIEQELDPVMRATLDENLMTGFGMDVGRHRDLSVLCPMQITRLMKRIVPFIVELSRVPFQQQEQIRDHLVRGLPRFIGGRTDAGGIGASLAESGVQRFGQAMQEVKFTTEWYRVEMPPLKAAFEDAAILIPRDAEIAADLRAFKTIRGVARLPDLRVKAAAGGTRHGDAGIALALAYAATRQPFQEYAYESAARAARIDDDDDEEPSDAFGRRRDELW
jgi:phage FluMu gp28-like protein